MLSGRTPAAAGRPGHVGGGAGDAISPPEGEQVAIPQKMKAGFSALIANARKVNTDSPVVAVIVSVLDNFAAVVAAACCC